MPAADYSSYHQPPGTGGDGTKLDNLIDAIQTTVNGLDNNNFASGLIFDPNKLMQSGATVGQTLVWNGSAWDNALTGLYRKTTARTVNTTVAETDLLNGEITIGAGVMGANATVRLTARGDWKQNSGASAPAPRFKLKLGATTLLDTGAMSLNTFGNSASRFGWRIDATIANLGVTGAQWAHTNGVVMGIVASTDNGAFATGEGGYWTPNSGSNTGAFFEGGNSGTVDTTGACALVVSVINGANNANYEVVLKHATVEVV